MQEFKADYLDFTQIFFEKMHIHVRRLYPPYIWSEDLDLELRKTLLGAQSEDFAIVTEAEKDVLSGEACLLIKDEYQCSYILLPIPDSPMESILFIGPFLINELSRKDIAILYEKMAVPEIHQNFLYQYYNTIPAFRDSRCLESFLECLGIKLYEKEDFRIRTLSIRTTGYKKVDFDDNIPAYSNRNAVDVIVRRYKNEAMLMEAIKAGDYRRACSILHSPNLFTQEKRTENTVRNRKNYMIIFNTLCRKAAELGNVHPLYLDRLSGELAVKIENQHTENQLKKLENEIVRKYCLLVQRYSTNGCSPIISDVINYISMNLSGDLGLSSIACLFSINSSYLSSLFKKECGVNFSAYVLNRRMEHAIFLLNTQNCSIQEIAVQCGISDLTYFTKLFKNKYGMPPGEYRKMISRA